MTKPLQRALDSSVKKIPVMALEKILATKLKSGGIRDFRRKAHLLAEHLLAKGDEPFEWGSGNKREDIQIHFDDDDIRELEKLADKSIEQLPSIVTKLAYSTALRVVDRSISMWREERYKELRDLEGFRNRLEDRWGEPLDLLRLLLSVGREIGANFHDRLLKSRARKNRHLQVALSQLHIRACQVGYEILVLLENGLPDGAMARWRTLHEIATVALFIREGGDDLARRYLEYAVIETKKALDRFLLDHVALGYAPPSDTEKMRTQKAYDSIIERYGTEFSQQYGWAARHLGKKSPRFSDIQEAAGRAMMHSHYKLASYNVHASPKALSNRMGTVDDPTLLISGSTNAGLEEPGQNLAITLVQATSSLFGPSFALDDLVEMQSLVLLRDRATAELIAAQKKLKREHREIQRAIREGGLEADIIW